MNDLTFRDSFTGIGTLRHNTINDTDVIFGKMKPFYTHSTLGNPDVFSYTPDRQGGGRSLTQAQVKEVINGGKIPALFRIDGNNYLLAKGFCASKRNTDGKIIPLFIAMHNPEARNIEDIKFYFSQEIFSDTYKRMKSVMIDYISNHKGLVVITPELDKYFRIQVEAPSGRTLKEKKENTEAYLDKLMEKVKSSV